MFRILLALLIIAAYGLRSESRGKYFAKKKYQSKELPYFQAKNLPSPILENSPELVELYWAAWRLAFLHLKSPILGSPLVSNYIDAAFSTSIFQWDSLFMLSFAKYGHSVFPFIQSLDNFYARQHDDGFICREIESRTGQDYYYQGKENSINPPLFAWIEVEYARFTGDFSRFSLIWDVLIHYAKWLEQNRQVKDGTVQHLYWNTLLGSGMDNSPRSGSGWIDMSAQMVLMYDSLDFIATYLGKTSEAAALKNKSAAIRNEVQKWQWDSQSHFYYDVNNQGERLPGQTAAGFWPLLAHIANPEQAGFLVGHLTNPESFWRKNVFPTLAANHPHYHPAGEYWLGSIWAPTNVMIIKGLEAYGYDELAFAATSRYLDNMASVYKDTGTIWENYAPESASRGCNSKSDFVGWSGAGPIQLLIENILGIRVDGYENIIYWQPLRLDENGIENIQLGTQKVSLLIKQRDNIEVLMRIEVKAQKPFKLIFTGPMGIKSFFQISPGITKLPVKA